MPIPILVHNKYGVSVSGKGEIVLLFPPRGPMTADDALMLAAWIVALADPEGEQFKKNLEAVQGT